MACIYQIKNLVNSKIYIGSTQHDFLKRKGEHTCELKGNYHFNSHLQSAWNKYGEQNFKFEIIEDFVFPNNYDREYIYEYITSRELYYINFLNPSYNILREISGGKLGRVQSEEAKQHLRELFTGRKISEETKIKIRLFRSKQIITEETKRKISESCKGNTNKLGVKQTKEQIEVIRQRVFKNISEGRGFHSEESKIKRTATLKITHNTPEMKQKFRDIARNRTRRTFICFKDNELVNEFTSQIEAAEALGFDKPSGIWNVLNRKAKSYKGYNFIYKTI